MFELFHPSELTREQRDQYVAEYLKARLSLAHALNEAVKRDAQDTRAREQTFPRTGADEQA